MTGNHTYAASALVVLCDCVALTDTYAAPWAGHFDFLLDNAWQAGGSAHAARSRGAHVELDLPQPWQGKSGTDLGTNNPAIGLWRRCRQSEASSDHLPLLPPIYVCPDCWVVWNSIPHMLYKACRVGKESAVISCVESKQAVG